METVRRSVFVAPDYEDDIRALAERIGVDHVLMGSDFPHAEGLSEPASFVEDLRGFEAREIQGMMRDNGRALVKLRPASQRWASRETPGSAEEKSALSERGPQPSRRGRVCRAGPDTGAGCGRQPQP